jgi:4-hydroxymandelate oxidase
MEPVNVLDFEAAARERLSTMAYGYYASGADDEVTLRENRMAFERLRLRPHVLVDVSRRDLETEVLGQRLSMPILVAPTAFHKLACPEGEAATARGAARAGTVMILSTLSTTALEEVVPAAAGRLWFQLYVYRDRGATRGLVERAEAAGCKALVLTVDVPVLGRRERDVRNRFRLPEGIVAQNLLPAGYEQIVEVPRESGLAAYASTLLDPSLSWKDVEWLCATTRLPVVVKGILRPDDALRAVEHGAAGIGVSNHGGRQLDTTPPPIEALPAIAEAVAGRCTLLLDGGVRRGTDVVKALALGAQAVLVGRPVLWGLAAAGEDGVARVLEILRDELDRDLALCGCPTIRDVTRDLVAGPA